MEEGGGGGIHFLPLKRGVLLEGGVIGEGALIEDLRYYTNEYLCICTCLCHSKAGNLDCQLFCLLCDSAVLCIFSDILSLVVIHTDERTKI